MLTLHHCQTATKGRYALLVHTARTDWPYIQDHKDCITPTLTLNHNPNLNPNGLTLPNPNICAHIADTHINFFPNL